MSEVTHEWDNFYGYKYFYPGLYTPEEAWGQKGLMKLGMWPLVLDICCSAGIGECYISRVHPQGHCVLLSNKYGWPMMEVKINSEGGYALSNWYQHLKSRGRNRYEIHSAKRPYIVKNLQPFLNDIINDTKTSINTHLVVAAQSVNVHLNTATNNAARIGDQVLSPEGAYAALRLIFDPDCHRIQVDQLLMNKLEAVYKELSNKFANKKTYMERLKDMFDHPKWMIAYVPMYGINFMIIGTVKYTIVNTDYNGSYKTAYEMSPQLYRNFEQFYAAHPEDEGSLKTALMFCKVHREKSPEDTNTYDKEGFIPKNNRGVYEDIGGISYCNSYSGAMITTPHFLLLQK